MQSAVSYNMEECWLPSTAAEAWTAAEGQGSSGSLDCSESLDCSGGQESSEGFFGFDCGDGPGDVAELGGVGCGPWSAMPTCSWRTLRGRVEKAQVRSL